MPERVLSMLMKFNRNILFTMFDFLPTETVFLSIALINQLLYSKVRDYLLVAETIELKDLNYPICPIFPRANNMILHITNHNKDIEICLPKTLQFLRVYYSNNSKVVVKKINAELEALSQISMIPGNSQIRISDLLENPSRLKKIKLNTRRYDSIIDRLDIQTRNKIEELYICIPSFPASSIMGIISCQNLQKLTICGILSVPLDIQLLSGLKNLTYLKLDFPNFNENCEDIDGVIKSLQNLTIFKISWNTPYRFNIGILNSMKGKKIRKFRSDMIANNSDFIIFLEQLLENFPNLEAVKLKVQGLDFASINHTIENVIALCTSHTMLNTFNGIPIKNIETGKVISIGLYESLLVTSFSWTVQVDLTLCLLHHYRSFLSKVYELKIKPIAAAYIWLYKPKLLEKIKTIGHFSDLMNEFKIPKYAFIPVFLMICDHSELTRLKLMTIHRDPVFLSAIQQCIQLQEFEGALYDFIKESRSLKKIILRSINKPIPLSYILATLKNPELESLKISPTKIMIEDEAQIVLLEREIAEIRLYDVEVSPGFINLCNLLELSRIRILSLVLNVIVSNYTTAEDIAFLSKFVFVKVLSLTFTVANSIDTNRLMVIFSSATESIKQMHELEELKIATDGNSRTSTELTKRIYIGIREIILRNPRIRTICGKSVKNLTESTFIQGFSAQN
jgi:hypothetical protein